MRGGLTILSAASADVLPLLSVGMLGLLPTATMQLPMISNEVNIGLVTMAGTECTVQANLTHYEDVMEL